MISLQKKQQLYSALLLFLFSTLILSIIPLYRIFYYQALPPGETVYSHLFLGRYIFENGIPVFDPHISINQPYSLDLFDLLLGFVGKCIGMYPAALLFPFALGLLTVFFCYRLFLLVFSPKQALLGGIFLVSSPIFLTLFSQATNITLLLPILCAGFFFFFQKNWTKYLSFFFFGLLIFSEPIHILLTILLLFCFLPKDSKYFNKNPALITNRKYFFLLFLFLFLILLGTFSSRTFSIVVHTPDFFSKIQNFFSDFGGDFGFSIFTFILVLASITTMIQRKILTPLFCFFFLTIFSLLFFVSSLYIFYLLPFFAFGALVGFEKIIRHQWKLEYLSQITLFLFILGIIFSTTSTISRIAKEEPTPEVLSAFSWLAEHSYEDSVVYTSASVSSWVTYISQRKVLIDKKLTRTNNAALLSDNQKIISARHINETISLLEKYDVDYIAVVSDIHHDYWNMNNGNLLFLLQNSAYFKLVFQNDRVKIWNVTYS